MALSFHALSLSDSGLSLKILPIKCAALDIVLVVSSNFKKNKHL